MTLQAHVVDSIYMDVNDATVTSELTAPSGKITTLPLDWTLRNDGTYAGHFVAAEAGTYQFTAMAVHGTDSTRSSVSAVLADSRGADMDHAELRTALLRRIANETGGKYYPIADLAHLPDDVMITGSGVTAHELRDLWDMPVVLLAFVLLLGGEWAYRRWRGLA